MQWSISVRPATSTSGFGVVSVIGRMRLPRPAANTMAVFGTGALIVDRSRVGMSEITIVRRAAQTPAADGSDTRRRAA